LKVFLWILLFLAAAEFLVRGPLRYLQERGTWNDLSQNYTASKIWLSGKSPADPRNFQTFWWHEGLSRLPLTDIRTHLAPLPGGLVIMAPIAALPWKIAKITWMVVLLISFLATVWSLLAVSGIRSNESHTLVFIAAALALAPFHTGLASGNPTILVVGLCAVAIWAASSHHELASGILFGIACAMKPHLAAFIVLYYLAQRRWRLFTVAVSCTATLNLIAILYLYLRRAPWLHDYLNNAKGFVTANNIDSFASDNPSRFTLINLQVPFFSITGSSSSSNLWAFVAGSTLICAWLYWIVRKENRPPQLLALGAISAIALLPVYHRFYDAALLIVPLCWCIANVDSLAKKTVRVALFLMTPFLVPGAAFLQQLAAKGRIPYSSMNSWVWNCLIMPHETWALLALTVVLLYGIRASLDLASSANEQHSRAPRAAT
jgi:hypothetical protein